MQRKRQWLLIFLSSLLISCGGDDDASDSGVFSREGESCTKTADCESGLRCVDLECVQDNETSDGDETDGDTSEGDFADGDSTERDLSWLSIPGGSFEMGCSIDDNRCNSSENPRHRVTVPGFKMTKYEVTNAQYVEFINNRGSNECSTFPCMSLHPYRWHESGGLWRVIRGHENHPVVQVTWYGAKAFCQAAGGRLPSEAEWEYAARAGTTTRYYCGDESICLPDVARWNTGSTCPVGQYDPNDFGLYDMLGGVWEWVEDCWHDDYDGAPTDGTVWDRQFYTTRVLRGGSYWSYSSRSLGASSRSRLFPYELDTDIGFRCARD